MSDFEQAVRAEAWAKHLRSKRNHRQARRSSFDAGWSAFAEYLLSDENVEKAAWAIGKADQSPYLNSDQADARTSDHIRGYRMLARAALQAVLGKEQS